MNLPDFADTRLAIVTACCSVDSKELRAQFHENRYDYDAVYGDGHWLHVVASTPDTENKGEDCVHFHVDAVAEFGDGKTPATTNLDELLDTIASFYGKSCQAWLKARYKIPVEKFPKGGLVSAVSRLSTKAGGTRLKISGMRFQVEDDDEAIDEIEWWQGRDDNVSVVVDAVLPATIDSDLLKNAEVILSSGLTRFLLGDEEDESRSGTGN